MTMQRRGNKAAVQVRKISREEAFAAANRDSVRESTQTFNNPEGGEANITHTGAERILMWKPVIDDRNIVRDFVTRAVPVSHIDLNLFNGWRSSCPACETNHEDSPLPPSDPNSCPAKDKVAVRFCPVPGCGKRILDNQGWVGERQGITVDGEEVISNDDMTSLTTPAERTEQLVKIHLWMRHPKQAQMMGIPELQGSYRDAVNAIRPS